MTNPSKAQSWIQQHLQPYLSQTKITCITVGNEVFNTNDTQLIMNLLPAMESVHGAHVNLGLHQQVTVTTAHSFNILSNSYPPSSGSFRQDLLQYIQPLLAFHSQFNSPFLINAYPFFAYKDNPSEVSLSYEPNPGSIDPNTNLNYDNMLYAQIDAVDAAIKMLILRSGFQRQVGLLRVILMKLEPHQRMQQLIMPGPASERNYGLYYPDGTPVYNIGLQGFLPEMVIASSSNGSAVNFLACIITCFISAWKLLRL
ncbi:hypothetical protein AHAS_Ahas08G0057800 [Arachis hypogaea]